MRSGPKGSGGDKNVPDSASATFTISDLAAEFGVTPRTLRYYEEFGLLSPQRVGGDGQRLYSRRDKARVKLILRGRRFGFALKDMRELLDLYDTDPTRKEQIRRTLEIGHRRISEIEEMIRELQVHRQELLDYSDRLLGFLDGKTGPEVLDLPVEPEAENGRGGESGA